MKLGILKSAIRALKGAPSVLIHIPNVGVMSVAAQKTALLATLDDAFEKQRGVETGLTIDDSGTISLANGELALDVSPASGATAAVQDEDDTPSPAPAPAPAAAASPADLDDLLG